MEVLTEVVVARARLWESNAQGEMHEGWGETPLECSMDLARHLAQSGTIAGHAVLLSHAGRGVAESGGKR